MPVSALGKLKRLGLRPPERKWWQSCPSVPFSIPVWWSRDGAGSRAEGLGLRGTRLVNFRGLPFTGDHQRKTQLRSLGRAKRNSSWVQSSGPAPSWGTGLPRPGAVTDLTLPGWPWQPSSGPEARIQEASVLGRPWKERSVRERVNSSGARKAGYWRGLFLGFLLLKLKLCFNYIFLFFAHSGFCILCKHPCQSFILVRLWVLLNPLHSQPYHLWFGSVQFSRSVVSDSVTPWIAAHQASLSITNSRSSLRLKSIESVLGLGIIQPSHPLSSPSPAPNPSQHQSLFHWVSSLHEVAKVLEFQLQHQSLQRTPRTDLL